MVKLLLSPDDEEGRAKGVKRGKLPCLEHKHWDQHHCRCKAERSCDYAQKESGNALEAIQSTWVGINGCLGAVR